MEHRAELQARHGDEKSNATTENNDNSRTIEISCSPLLHRRRQQPVPVDPRFGQNHPDHLIVHKRQKMYRIELPPNLHVRLRDPFRHPFNVNDPLRCNTIAEELVTSGDDGIAANEILIWEFVERDIAGLDKGGGEVAERRRVAEWVHGREEGVEESGRSERSRRFRMRSQTDERSRRI